MKRFSHWYVFRPYQRHSLVLMIAGLVYILIGLMMLLSINELTDTQAVSLIIALRIAPLNVWAVLFIASGFMAFLSSRWPQFSDSWGYMVLCGLSSGWATVYILGFLLGPAPATNLIQTVIWGLMGFIWWAISGLTNPERRRAGRRGINRY